MWHHRPEHPRAVPNLWLGPLQRRQPPAGCPRGTGGWLPNSIQPVLPALLPIELGHHRSGQVRDEHGRQPVVQAADAWLRSQGLLELLQPVKRWLGAYWAFALDDPKIIAWCRLILE